MVIVESMGELRDSALRAYVWEPIEAAPIKQRYRSVRGVVPFRGGTTSGELRELCGIFADYITLPWSALPRCLPRRLHVRGFDTFALHGYKESYYDRERWYPALFEKSHFESALDDDAPERRCGTQFRGICDRDAFIVLRRLARDRHRFIYWMTLDAHTPVDVARMREFRADWQAGGLDQRAICRTAAAVCLQALFWRDLLRQLAGLALDAQLPPTRFLIVGDHAPAFVRRDRAMGYIFGVVPYLELLPRR
jgi:phosphoglycerol transferase MdoB-like AlkP superfamily enzyme